jgi:Tfp pilus assembly protein PilF
MTGARSACDPSETFRQPLLLTLTMKYSGVPSAAVPHRLKIQLEAMQGLGRAHLATGQYEQALADHHRALDIAGELEHPGDRARAHDGLAHASQTLGQHDHARQHWQAALEILTALDTDHTEDPEMTTSTLRERLS